MLDNLLTGVTLVAWGVFVVYLILVALRGYQVGGTREAGKELISGRVLAILVILILLSLFSASLVFIEPQEVGVVVSLFSRDGYREPS